MYVSAGAQLGLRIGALGAAGVGGAVATYAVDRAAGPDGSGVSAPVRNAVHAAPVLLGVGGLASIGLGVARNSHVMVGAGFGAAALGAAALVGSLLGSVTAGATYLQPAPGDDAS